MFSELMKLIVLFFFAVVVFIPLYVRLMKNSLYDEWKEIWKSEIEAEKKKLAMPQNENKVIKKTH